MRSHHLKKFVVVLVFGATLPSEPAWAERIAATYCVAVDVSLEHPGSLSMNTCPTFDPTQLSSRGLTPGPIGASGKR